MILMILLTQLFNLIIFYLIALWSSRPEATAEQGKLMAAHMKFFLRCGGKSHRFSVIKTFTEMNELHHKV